MKLIHPARNKGPFVKPEQVPKEITEEDEKLFFEITSQELSADEKRRVLTPPETFPREEAVLGIHWHPEFIPMDLIDQRINTMFPNRKESLIIPTQHNVLMAYEGYSGVEVDCYSKGFNQKVQLLLHFKSENLSDAAVLRAMLDHTFQYRSTQLFDFIDTIIRPVEDRINQAAAETGSGEDLIGFARVYVQKIKDLLDRNESLLAPDVYKNKLLRNFFDGLRPAYGDAQIDRVQTYLKAVKQAVKSDFPHKYFYRTSEIIEEARKLGAGIVIPHPEQFWPILLAEYDVDGYEVWNPQSRRYTEFLISVLHEKNKKRCRGEKPLLIFMGDDTHMSEKTRPAELRDEAKALREIGYQPAWRDLRIRKKLICADMDKTTVIREYITRLSG